MDEEKIPQLFRYFGSKARMSSAIATLVPPDTTVLVSLFMGSGVFEYNYAKNNPDCQVICFDIDAGVVNYHKQAIKKRVKLREAILSLHDSLCASDTMSKEEYGKLLAEHRASSRQTGLDGAARFYILTAYSFSGKFGNYAVKESFFQPPGLFVDLPKNFEVHRRDALQVLEKGLDSMMMNNNVCIYLDPPYMYPSKNDYYTLKKMFDHERLAYLLKACPFRWILSYNNDVRVKQLYRGQPTMSLPIVYTYYNRNKQVANLQSICNKAELVIFHTKPTIKQRNNSRKLFKQGQPRQIS